MNKHSCREDGKHGEESSVVVAGDAERPLAAHRRTSSRPLEELAGFCRSHSGAAQGDDKRGLGSPDNKKDK